jgi:branched-chain amino acid transport system permease protein
MSTVLSNGLVNGAIYGLVAFAIALVYKKSRVLNFAQGETGMLGAFVFYELYVGQHLPYLVAGALGVGVSAVLGAVIFLVLSQHRDEPLNMLVGSLAIAGILVFIATKIWGTDQYFVPAPFSDRTLELFGLRFIGPRLVVLVAAVVIAIGCALLFTRSRFAVMFRASASDPYGATLVGIDVVRLDVISWALAGGLAGVAAILVAPLVGFSVFFMTLLAVRGLAAALLGGLDNPAAALVAGLAIGIGESVVTRQTTQAGAPEVALLALMVLVLLLRPAGRGRLTA